VLKKFLILIKTTIKDFFYKGYQLKNKLSENLKLTKNKILIKKGEFMKKCTSCNKIVTDDKTEFKCPSCGKETIIRCNSCKMTSKEYTCKECGFVGP